VITPARGPALESLTFVIPGGWFPLRLPEDQSAIDRLLEDQVARFPQLVGDQQAVRTMLGGLLEASRLCVLRAYATAVPAPAGLLPAGLAVSVVPMPGRSFGDLAANLPETGTAGWSSVQVLDLPAGPVLRAERLAALDGVDPPLTSLVVQYTAVAPGGSQAVMMTFSSPALTLASTLRLLFHQIACTLAFKARQPEPAG